jgi:hypothetical protein
LRSARRAEFGAVPKKMYNEVNKPKINASEKLKGNIFGVFT